MLTSIRDSPIDSRELLEVYNVTSIKMSICGWRNVLQMLRGTYRSQGTWRYYKCDIVHISVTSICQQRQDKHVALLIEKFPVHVEFQVQNNMSIFTATE